MADRPDPEERVPLGYLVVERLTQPQFVLALASGGFLAWLTYRLLMGAIPEQARELVAALVGFISGQMVGPAWQFFLGTTQGSEKKTSALSDNAATLRRKGDLAPPGSPTPVEIKQPAGQPVPVAEAHPEPRGPMPDPEEEIFR